MSLWRVHTIRIAVRIGAAAATANIITVKQLDNHGRNYYHHRQNMRIIDTIDEFKKPTVHMKDPQQVEELVSQFIKDGKKKLQVIIDFDYTLSRFHKNGVKCQTCHGALMDSPLIGKRYMDQSASLYNTYHPVELDVKMSLEDKAPLMREWWDKSHEIFAKCQVHKTQFPQVIQNSNVMLRSGADWLLKRLHDNDVPVLVLSAGLGDLVTEAIKQQAVLSDNMTVIANFMEFDENGRILGFKTPVIHSCNKNISTIKHEGYFEKFTDRSNVIIVGDSLGDLTMADGVKELKSIIKIGFLNEKIEEALPEYLAGYDIVIIDDQTMNLINALLTKIF